MLADVQGWQLGPTNYLLTDPAIMANQHKKVKAIEGGADCGWKGVCTFFKKHKCNEVCRALDLLKNKPKV